MFGGFRRLLGLIKVTQNHETILVEGIPGDVMSRDISRIWNTSRISTYMFTKIGKNAIEFPLFFAPDLVYCIDMILQDRTRYVSKRVLHDLREKLLTETWLANTNEVKPDRLNLAKLDEFIYSPLEHQMDFINFYNTQLDKYNLKGMLFAGAAGSGKAQPLTAKIKVPGGWSTMGEMKVGTEIVAKDGSTTKVTAVYPQGEKDIYKITFADGRSTECCAEHLWRISRPKGPILRHEEIIDTLKLKDYLENFKYGERIHIDLLDSEEGEYIDFKINPYLLGVYLGDGGSSKGTVHFTTPDEFIANKIIDTLPADCLISVTKDPSKCLTYRIIKNIDIPGFRTHSLKISLNEIGLLGLLSHDKFIPKEYLNSCKKQRLELLQGLMDTDGTIGTKGTSSYSTTSEQLALDVQYLVRSLGGIAKISSRIPTFTYLDEKKDGKLAYQVNIRYKKPSELFTLPKKKERTNDEGQYNSRLKLRVESVELIGRKEAQCISIEHPDHLYVTDDFIVTHNTLSALMIANCLDADLIVIVSPKNAIERVWESSIQTLYKHKQTYWMSHRDVPIKGNERFIIGNYEAIDKIASAMLTRKAKIGRDAKVMVILDESHNLNEIGSLRTQRFIDLCVASGSKDILELSGTPIKALGAESLPLLRCIDPYFTPDVEVRFKKIFGKDAAKGLDILQHRLGLVMFKVEKKALNLLDPIIKTVKVKIPNGVDFTLNAVANDMSKFIEQQVKFYANTKETDEALFYGYLKTYEDSLTSEHDKLDLAKYKHNLKAVIAAQGFLKEVIEESLFCNKFEKEKIIPMLQGKDKESFRHVKTLVKYVSLKIQGECLGRVLGKKRIDCHVAMVPHINFVEICESTTKKTIVFTSFVEALRATEQTVRDAGLEPVMVYGDTNKDLNKIIKDFESNPNTNPLVATFNSLSTAVPLIMADTMIMLNAPFRGYIQEQAISRIHRIGADTQTTVYMMSLDTGAEPNLSTRSSDILAWSQKQVEKILGISAPFEITEGFENLEEGGAIRISMESLDIHEVIPVSKLQSVTSLSNW